jgi:hypothetical protein
MVISKHGGWLLLAALAGAHAAADDPGGAGRPIYRCNSGDAVTFSDRPCDAAAEVYAATTPLNTSEPPKAESRPRTAAPTRPARAVARSGGQRNEQASLAEKCQRIQQSLRDIRSKMRAGYTVKEGERLRERRARLDQQRRSAKCR